MVLLNTKGSNTSGNIIPLKLDISKPQAIKIPWNMSKQIKVGKRSDGYTIMQALDPLIEMGYYLRIEQGDSDPIKVTLLNEKNKARRSGEGGSLSVALRRMSVGMSKEFSHMIE